MKGLRWVDRIPKGEPAIAAFLLAVRLLAWRKVPLLEETRADYAS